MGRRRSSPSRSGRDGEGRSCCGFFRRFGVPAWCSTRSRREDVTWSGGDVVPWPDCVFFAE
ncbi:hypothetical protein Taro_028233, partial [Colocasia esculenta]|nr:hypothetical protein [Colocasia esculenta]